MNETRRSFSDTFTLLFIKKSDKGFIQFFRYIFAGGISAVADIGTLFFAVSVLHVHYLIAAAAAFLVGNIVNYLISIAWVFSGSGQFKKELFFFTIIGLGWLGLNELIIWIGVEFGHLHYMLAKIVAVSLIVVYSFSARRILLIKLRQQQALKQQ